MNHIYSTISYLSIFMVLLSSSHAEEWRTWRGPNLNGIADSDQTVPTEWTQTKNVLWKTNVPGRGHSSPTIVNDLVVLTSADKATESQAVFGFNKKTGKQLWATLVNKGGLPAKIHAKNTHASPTAISDGKMIYVVFNNNNSIQVAALTLAGKIVWKKVTGKFSPKKYEFGFAPSPQLYEGKLIVTGEYDGPDSSIVALNTNDGSEAWRVKRQSSISFSTPVIADLTSGKQLVISGNGTMSSYNPSTGKLNWQTKATSPATCGTAVWLGDTIFASGGYPNKETVAISGSGKVLWKNNEKCYEQSMLAYDGHVYGVNDTGIAFCWDAKTGEEKWKERLGGSVSASPVLVNDTIYFTNEAGMTFVFKATPERYEEVARNKLGDEGFPTMSICGNRIYLRATFKKSGGRQEVLYCIGSK